MHYVAVIDKDPDSAWGIQFPEVPGCFSAADTFEEIVSQRDRGVEPVLRGQRARVCARP